MIEPPAWSSSPRWKPEYTPYLIAGGLAFALVLSFPAVVGPAASVAIAAFGVWWWRRERQRRQRLCELAAAKGWTYAARDDTSLAGWTAQPLTQGARRRTKNVVTLALGGRRIVACDYCYRVVAYGGHMLANLTVMSTTLGYLPVPVLTVRPTVRPMFGPDPWAGPFEQAFQVSAADPAFAAAVLTPAVTQFLRDEGLGISWHADGTSLVTWRPGRLDPAKLEREAAFLARLADLVSAAADGHR